MRTVFLAHTKAGRALNQKQIHRLWRCDCRGSAVPGVSPSHRNVSPKKRALIGSELLGLRRSRPRRQAGPGATPVACPEVEGLPGAEDQGQAIVDSTQRPLQGAFLIPPVLPVVLIQLEATASGRGPKELRAIRRASSENRAGLGIRDVSGGEAVAERRRGARVRLISSPPTGATSRNRPARGAFLIPRPLAEEPHSGPHSHWHS